MKVRCSSVKCRHRARLWVRDQWSVADTLVAVDFSASCHEPGSVREVMKELSFFSFYYFSYHFLDSFLQFLYHILGRSPRFSYQTQELKKSFLFRRY